MAKIDIKVYVENRLRSLFEEDKKVDIEDKGVSDSVKGELIDAKIEEVQNMASYFGIKIRHILKEYDQN